MINKQLSFSLPLPWSNKRFETQQIGYINFLVGPNGSGKSKFAQALKPYLENVRLLGTDRLSGMEQTNILRNTFGDHFAHGLAKNQFSSFRSAGQEGSGIDTIVLLEERMDLRIQVEATLSHLFNRKIIFEWDSGHLVARAVLGEGTNFYRLDRDECHGIKELLVLLTHLYNDQHSYLIIDEPELNLHPQYQAFFMQEVRKYAGDPSESGKKKIVFLITHSPFILDFQTIEDVKSVISFNLDHSIPKHIFSLDSATSTKLSSLVPRLNVHHKQLFFSDNPIFVEGIFDSQLIGTMQEARGVSVAGAGSCIIDASGCEEVNQYLELCTAFGKKAYFLYDLDSLFFGNLRACIRDDGFVQSFLAAAGLGSDFTGYCGELDRKLTGLINKLLSITTIPPSLARLLEYLKSLSPNTGNQWDKKKMAKARVAVMTAISRHKSDMVLVTAESEVADIEGRLCQIVTALKQKNIFLLPGGTLERYLPSYDGDHYELNDGTKRNAVIAEIGEMAKKLSESELAVRYGELYDAVCRLPAKVSVDINRVLRNYLGHYIHDLQVAVVNNLTWGLDQVQVHLNAIQPTTTKIFSIQSLTRGQNKEFNANIGITEMVGHKRKLVQVSHETNAGMGNFEITDD
jgi:hypothetical protein